MHLGCELPVKYVHCSFHGWCANTSGYFQGRPLLPVSAARHGHDPQPTGLSPPPSHAGGAEFQPVLHPAAADKITNTSTCTQHFRFSFQITAAIARTPESLM